MLFNYDTNLSTECARGHNLTRTFTAEELNLIKSDIYFHSLPPARHKRGTGMHSPK